MIPRLSKSSVVSLINLGSLDIGTLYDVSSSLSIVEATHQTSVVHTLDPSFNAITLHRAAFRPCHRSCASLSVLENIKSPPPCLLVTAWTPFETSVMALSELKTSQQDLEQGGNHSSPLELEEQAVLLGILSSRDTSLIDSFHSTRIEKFDAFCKISLVLRSLSSTYGPGTRR